MTQNQSDIFSHLIGQQKLKQQLGFYLQAFQSTGILPHIFLVGGKGQGKTEFATGLARNLRTKHLGGKPKPMLVINGSTLENLTGFVENICMKYITPESHLTVFFDECHEIPTKIQTALLTILNPNKQNKNNLRFKDYNIEFDFTKISFVFATTDPQGVIGPMKDRCRILHMDEYEYEELGRIVETQLDSVSIPREIIPEVAGVCRGNARNAILMGKDNITQFCAFKSSDTLTRDLWEEMKHTLGIFPLGLETSEIHVLRSVACYPEGSSLTNIASKTGYTRGAIQREFEPYLIRHGLIYIQQSGRKLTQEGLDMLRKIDKILEKRKALGFC